MNADFCLQVALVLRLARLASHFSDPLTVEVRRVKVDYGSSHPS
jgi:hypothetical protein